MNIQDLGDKIHDLGFTGWRALPPMDFGRWQIDRQDLMEGGHYVSETVHANADLLLPGATAMLVLMTAYAPWSDWPRDSLWVHPYYPASHRTGQAAGELVGWIREQGYRSVDAHRLPQRHAAFAAGFGHTGRNGLLIHPRYGSRICFATLLTDAPLPLAEPVTGEMRRCLDCGACAAACTGGAIAGGSVIHAERCLRHFAPMKREIPEALRTALKMRYIGCDDCQSVCPLNQGLVPVEPPGELIKATRLAGLLDWGGDGWREQITALGRWIGVNEARPVRTTAAAALHAGNSGDPAYLPALHRLESHPESRIRDMAVWAIGQIKDQQ